MGNRKPRYHLCPQCAFRCKSIATDDKPGVEPTTIQLRYLRKYGKREAGRRIQAQGHIRKIRCPSCINS